MRSGKYNNRLIREDNICFKSLLEHKRYQELKWLLYDGKILHLKVHTRWKLTVQGILITTYEDDFNYHDASGAFVVEDTKGFRTAEFKIKKNLMKACYGIEVVEVT